MFEVTPTETGLFEFLFVWDAPRYSSFKYDGRRSQEIKKRKKREERKHQSLCYMQSGILPSWPVTNDLAPKHKITCTT